MYLRFVIAFLFASQLLFGQKKPLNHSVYDAWQTIGYTGLSHNGQWAAYTVNPQEGDGNLYLQNTLGNQKLTMARATPPLFTADGKFAAFTIKPLFAQVRLAKIKKKKTNQMPKDSLGFINLNTLAVTKVPHVKSFKLPKEGINILAYLADGMADTAKKKSVPQQDGIVGYLADDDTKKDNKEGNDLTVKNLTNGNQKVFKYVKDYAFNNSGKLLVFSCTGSKTDKTAPTGVFLLNNQTGQLKTLVNKKGNFKGFVFDDEGEHVAFLGETDPEKKEIKDYNIYFNSPSMDTAQVLVDKDTPGLPASMSISSEGLLFFSKNGNKLFFGIAKEKLPKDTTLVEFEHAKLDIWGYKDDYLQPMQLRNLDKTQKRSFLSVIDIYNNNPKVVALADDKLPDAEAMQEGNAPYALASTDFGNRTALQWTGNSLRNYYLVNVDNGSRKSIIEKLVGAAYPSPAGNFILYFNKSNSNWYTYQIATGKTHHLNAQIAIKLANEDNDMPDYPASYGFAGWLENDKGILIYDKYDIWLFSPDGKTPPKNLTNGFGRSNGLTFRVSKTNPDFKYFEKNETLILQAFDHQTKENGYWKKEISGNKNPELLTMQPATFARLAKAKNASTYLYQMGSYIKSPDVYLSKDLRTATKLSATNPQQANYNWGTAELVKWTTPKGYKSEGILYKPENFDPSKKYPMIVYFYEKLSEGLYNYIAPAPTPSRLNISYFVSNGYLVFAPDISYQTGHPAQSAVEFINSGVESLKKNTWVDGTKIGIQGQSWGGYQVAHLITATNMYAAAWAGAPVVNMTSAYGGIRWESGMNRQFQYEKTQSRIGATLWEKPELYIENSPLFHMPKVNTPVAIMANDADGAVPWYQGIEMFTALKRLGKPAWLLNYNNEAHNLMQRQNRKDIQIREQQFFDHYLKGAKAPVWMVSGISAEEKGKNWGFDLTDGKP